jgi:hypothetical protein
VYYFVDRMHSDDFADVHTIDVQSFPHPWSMTTYQNELRDERQSRYIVVRGSPHLPGNSAPTTTWWNAYKRISSVRRLWMLRQMRTACP